MWLHLVLTLERSHLPSAVCQASSPSPLHRVALTAHLSALELRLPSPFTPKSPQAAADIMPRSTTRIGARDSPCIPRLACPEPMCIMTPHVADDEN